MKNIIQTTKKFSVLYIEDNKEINEITTSVFKKFFKKVYRAENYDEAVSLFSRFSDIKILMTDIALPGKNGIEIAKEFKEKKPGLFVVFISAYNDSEHLLKAIEIGADGFLFKPFSLNDLIKVLRKISFYIKTEEENEKYKKELEKLVENQTKKLLIDDTTGLYNKIKLTKDIENCKKEFFIILLDINGFKKLNSAFGFEFGDEVLKHTAKKLTKFTDRVYRLASDQFVMLFERDINPKIFEKIKKEFDNFKLYFNNFPVYINYTFVSFYSHSCDIKDNISKATDYIKDKKIQNQAIFLDESKFLKISQKSKKLAFMLNMIRENKIFPYYQPIIDTRTGKISKFEVLARIINAEKIYTPFEFIDDIKKAGLINEITKQIISKSFEYVKGRHNISINITELDLMDENFIDFITAQANMHKIPYKNITLEILEDISTIKNKIILSHIQTLKEKGFLIALDDFGVGYSNFERVLQISPNFIKIDGKFIKNIVIDKNSQKITMAINILAHSIGAEVVAEFVENEKIVEKLGEIGIEYAQGYHFSAPKREINE